MKNLDQLQRQNEYHALASQARAYGSMGIASSPDNRGKGIDQEALSRAIDAWLWQEYLAGKKIGNTAQNRERAKKTGYQYRCSERIKIGVNNGNYWSKI